MRLNLDCVRDILFCVEDNTGLRKSCHFVDSGLEKAAMFVGSATETPDYEQKLLKKYDNDTLIYHLNYCVEADLLAEAEGNGLYNIVISDLTPRGHEFLSNIRNNSNWEKTKDVGSKIGAFGLNVAAKIAEGVATAHIKQVLGLP